VIRVTENLALISNLLTNAAVDAKREPNAVKLLAVSKKQPLEKILAAAENDQRDFGENFVQEGLQKIRQANRSDLIWHFIGHLQSNKTRDVAENFDWVHTVDKFKIARRLSEQRPESLPPLNICVQVNIDNEPGKSGVALADTLELAVACTQLPNLTLRGLMCLPMNRNDFDQQRAPYAALRMLGDALQREQVHIDTLSMGMSNDYAAAIHEGATIVRIGTAIFGQRS